MEAWIRSLDDYQKNIGQPPTTLPTWRTFADILYAAKFYD
jgi:hypothetical protein